MTRQQHRFSSVAVETTPHGTIAYLGTKGIDAIHALFDRLGLVRKNAGAKIDEQCSVVVGVWVSVLSKQELTTDGVGPWHYFSFCSFNNHFITSPISSTARQQR